MVDLRMASREALLAVIARQQGEIVVLQQQAAEQRAEIVRLTATVAEQRVTIARLEARVRDLEAGGGGRAARDARREGDPGRGRA
jgi:hypothetical protein